MSNIKFSPLPEKEWLESRFDYSSRTGRLLVKQLFRSDYKTDRGFLIAKSKLLGKTIGISAGGYIRVNICVNRARASLPAHRVIWCMHHGIPKGMMIDHIDGDGENNRIENLRLSDSMLNAINSKMPKNNTSGIMGVSFHKGDNRWLARARLMGKNYRVGAFASADEAGAAIERFRENMSFSALHGR